MITKSGENNESYLPFASVHGVPRAQAHEGRRYQTKDTPDQWLSEYRIVNGRLLGDEWHVEVVPKEQRPYPDEPNDSPLSLAGSMRRVVDKADIDLNWHGHLYLCADLPPHADYRAKFTDGNLVEFVQTDSE